MRWAYGHVRLEDHCRLRGQATAHERPGQPAGCGAVPGVRSDLAREDQCALEVALRCLVVEQIQAQKSERAQRPRRPLTVFELLGQGQAVDCLEGARVVAHVCETTQPNNLTEHLAGSPPDVSGKCDRLFTAAQPLERVQPGWLDERPMIRREHAN